MRIYCLLFFIISPILMYSQIVAGNYFSGILDLGGGITYILYENDCYAKKHSSCTFEHTRIGKYMLQNDSIIFNIPSSDSIVVGVLTESGKSLDSLYITLGRPFRSVSLARDIENMLKVKISDTNGLCGGI